MFSRTGEIGFKRAAYGISGRSTHSTVNPILYRAESADEPNTLLAPAHDGDHQILGEPFRSDQGIPQVRPIRQVLVRDSAGQFVPVRFPRRWSAEQLKAKLQQKNLGDAQLHAVYCDIDESPESIELRTVLTEVFGRFDALAFYGGMSQEARFANVTISAEVSPAYVRGVVKIAFHQRRTGAPVSQRRSASSRGYALSAVYHHADECGRVRSILLEPRRSAPDKSSEACRQATVAVRHEIRSCSSRSVSRRARARRCSRAC